MIQNYFHRVCYYLEQNNQTVPRSCGDSTFIFEGNRITHWNYEIKQPENETLSGYTDENVLLFAKKHKVMFNSQYQFMKNLINFALETNGLNVLLTNDNIANFLGGDEFFF